MEQNQAALTALSTEELAGLALELDQIWYTKLPGSTERQGPFSEEQLREFVHNQADFNPATLACNEANEEWVAIFDIPAFKRRKPTLVKLEKTENNNEYFLLVKGQKQGPFNHTEIAQKLKNKETLYNDFVSVDKGYNWFKMYELTDFDRRDSLDCVLPVAPSEEMFGFSRVASLKTIEEGQDDKEIVAMIASSGRRKAEEYNYTVPSDIPVREPWQKKRVVGGMMAVAMMGIFSYYSMTKSPTKMSDEAQFEENFATSVSPTQTSPSLVNPRVNRKPAAKKLAPIKSYNGSNQPRTLNQISRALNAPVPISDAQSNQINYDDPPEFHDMAEANETSLPPGAMNQKVGTALPDSAGQDYVDNEPPMEAMDQQPPTEVPGERLPAGQGEEYQDAPPEMIDPSQSGAGAAANQARGTEEEIFNQEVEN